nr:cysteine desulfurase family protein [uncultured Caldimonas sp.]
MNFIYLDHNATTPVAASARAEAQRFLETEYGNPSSGHAKGRVAKGAVDAARQAVAQLLRADPGEIVFTGSATEANNLALLGAAAAMPAERRHLIVSAVEHPAVMEPALALQRRGWELSVVRVDRHGVVDVQELEAMLRPDTAIVSVMHANNELGTLQPLQLIAPLVKRVGALMHVDAAQSVGKLPVDVDTLGADLLTLAGHKMYAPKGIGALYVRTGTPMQSVMYGAGQEHGLRPGTENVPYIAALGAAALEVSRLMPQKGVQMAQLRDLLQARLSTVIDGLLINGHPERRLPNTLHVSLPGGDARKLVARLAERIALSAGAACHSRDGAEEVSGVMRAIGATREQARGALRISLGYGTTAREVEQAAAWIAAEYKSMR